MDRRQLLRTGAAATAALGLGLIAPGSASATRRRGKPLRVHAVLYDGVEEQDFAGSVEVLGIFPEQIKQTFVAA